MRRFLIAAVLLCGCRQDVVIPENAAELRLALCPTELSESFDFTTFDQELTADSFRVFANEDLTGPLGGFTQTTAFGRVVSEDVWGVLAFDFENTVCEVYTSTDGAAPP